MDLTTSPTRTTGAPSAPPAGKRWLILAVLCISLLIVGLDTTVLNIALPTLVGDLNATTSQLQWIVDIYSLMAAALMLLGGSLADRLGRRSTFLAGLVLFGGGSAAAAWAGSPDALITARAAMGMGEALIMPSTLAIIGNVFADRAERAKAIAAWSGVVGLGIAIGPLLGGWLLGHFWWGSVFLINLPIAAVAVIAALALVPDSRSSERRRLDLAGALLSVLGLSSLLWAIIEGPVKGWTSGQVAGAFAAAAVLLTAFVVRQLRSDHPMLPLRIFANRSLAIGNILVLLGLFALLGTLFVLVQYLQFVLGYPAKDVGLRIAPTALIILLAAPVASLVGQKVGTRIAASVGLAFACTSLVVLATTSSDDGYGHALLAMLFLGAGAGFIIGPTSDAIVGSLTENDLGVGSATNSSSVQLGAALGVAVIGSLLSGTYRSELSDKLGSAVPGPAGESVGSALQVAQQLPGSAGTKLAEAAREAFVSGMHPAMFTGAGVAAAGILVALALFPRKGGEPS
ncbi:DHA2 family efflux MFS transporter permease subunit [Streptomyces sp. W16]|uniref:DHA2 family efflux MFS transporter permease subunit n=1 Tax=Streptomyces sp. W16 TaxID=3076631 RepID=UPI00295BC65A|nr:DHA2 family efflux MFS transporter permease subunit [Streptomyces sp. W16]MDV9169083.1 DHA2 family efflux MFS transporter permease subunit [Streptomyces sp. W16]